MGTRQSNLGEDRNGEVQNTRSKARARFYFSVIAVLFLILLIISVVSLGSFGVQQNRLSNFLAHSCILYALPGGVDPDNPERKRILLKPAAGVCIFVLWGLASIGIVSLLLLIYSIILAIVGLKVISPLRVLDFLVVFFSFLVSISLSITVSAGFNETCKAGGHPQCYGPSCLIFKGKPTEFCYKNDIQACANSSWGATVIFFGLSIWNCILLILYCIRASKTRSTRAEPLLAPVSSLESEDATIDQES